MKLEHITGELWQLFTIICSVGGGGGGGREDDSRCIDGEVPTWAKFFGPVLEKILERNMAVWEKSMYKVIVFTTRRAFRVI